MRFTFAKSSRCLVHFSVASRDGLDPQAVDEDACTPLVDEASIPMDMTFSAMRSMRIYSMDFSTTLNSLDMHARHQVGDQILLNVTEQVARSR
jgi:hypothetical protein